MRRRHDTNIPVKWTMEWTKEQVIILIELYEAHPVLWDPTDPSYKNKVKKVDAWKSISAALSKKRAEVEKKLKILNDSPLRTTMPWRLASFHLYPFIEVDIICLSIYLIFFFL